MSNSFGENLARIRTEKGLSQSALGDMLHVSRQAVSNWERGKSLPDLEMLTLIASALGVSSAELLQEKQGDGLGISLWPLLINLAAAAIHTVLAACGLVSFAAVTIVPWMCLIMMLIVALSFRAMFKSGNYDMLSGFNPKKDSVPKTRLQMYWLHLLLGLLSVSFQLVFAGLYFIERAEQLDTAHVLTWCYIGAFLVTTLAVNFKIKTR